MKRILSYVLITLLLITSSTISKGYTGVKSWFATEIKEADDVWNLIPESLQEADLTEPITRGEFADVISMAYLSVHQDYPFEFVTQNFVDTQSRTANAAFQLGIVTGFADQTYRENMVMSRQEMFTMLHRFLLIHSNHYLPFGEQVDIVLGKYADKDQVSDWAKGAVTAMLTKEIIKGTGNDTLNPVSTASRAEAIILAKRMLTVLCDLNPETVDMSRVKKELIVPITQTLPDPEYNPLYALGYNDSKYELIFASNGNAVYTSDVQARQFMESMTVSVWTMDSNGNKVPGKKTLLVNKAIVPMVTSIFETIYNGEEKFPIKDISCYAWRSSSTSEHRLGLAIDINPVENYMIRNDGSIVSGSLWDPGVNAYSIPENGDVVNAFRQYGFSWGGNAWRSNHDYMHFSYFGN